MSKGRFNAKKFFKLLAIIFLIYNLLGFVFFGVVIFELASCSKKLPSQEVNGDFVYAVAYYDKKDRYTYKEKSVRSKLMIYGLSDEGEKKEIIVIPEYIEGLKVEKIGRDLLWMGAPVIIESQNLKKLFIPHNIIISDDAIQSSDNLQGVFMLRHTKCEEYVSTGLSIFITSFNYTGSTTNFYDSDGYSDYYFSNVSYFYNYENAPNDGYFWIDNYGYGEKIEYIPQDPVREGYEFGGWYKESECINKWDFEIDTLPQAQFDDEEQEIYQETKLYAKWL